MGFGFVLWLVSDLVTLDLLVLIAGFEFAGFCVLFGFWWFGLVSS